MPQKPSDSDCRSRVRSTSANSERPEARKQAAAESSMTKSTPIAEDGRHPGERRAATSKQEEADNAKFDCQPRPRPMPGGSERRPIVELHVLGWWQADRPAACLGCGPPGVA